MTKTEKIVHVMQDEICDVVTRMKQALDEEELGNQKKKMNVVLCELEDYIDNDFKNAMDLYPSSYRAMRWREYLQREQIE